MTIRHIVQVPSADDQRIYVATTDEQDFLRLRHQLRDHRVAGQMRVVAAEPDGAIRNARDATLLGTVRWHHYEDVSGLLQRIAYLVRGRSHPDVQPAEAALQPRAGTMSYRLPRHLAIPTLSDLAWHILRLFAQQTMDAQHHTGYLATWHITRAVPAAADLGVVCAHDTPGNAAMRELQSAGLVEELPDLAERYRLTALGCALALLDAQTPAPANIVPA